MIRSWITKFGRDERGSVAVWMAGGFTVLMGIGAIAIDIGHVYVEEQRLQGAADIAVLAASKALLAGEDAGAAAITYTEKNMPPSVYGNVLSTSDVQQGVWDGANFAAGAASPNAVRVTLRRTQAKGNPVNTFLAGFLGHQQMDIEVQATAAATGGQPGCILALDPGSTSDSLTFNSMGTVDVKPCVPAANSTSSNAIKVSSMDKLRAGSLYAAGGISAPGWAVDLDEPEQEYQSPAADPYASLPDPAPGGCTSTNPNVGSNISPGVYCGGLIASGSVTMQPGTYYIVDGNLDMSSGSFSCNCTAPGSGVTFVLTGTTPSQIGTFEFSSINNLSLRAPSDGSYDFPGMLLYVDRNAPYATSKFSQIDNVTFNGGIYAPSQMLNFNSINYTAQTDCMHIVAYNIDFNSIDAFGRADNCGAYGTTQITLSGGGGSSTGIAGLVQ